MILRCLPLLALLLLPLAAPAGQEISEKKILEMVTEEYGPVVPAEKLPVLSDELTKLFQRLSLAQGEIIGAQHLSLNQLRVIDSPVLNAFVVTQKTDGVRRIHNHVFLTTGLLKKMFEENGNATSANGLAKGMVRIAGVLSHELAHPIEETDEESFKKNIGARVASQAREIRADAEGSLIAKRAGYPSEAVYEGLSRLFEDERSSGGIVEAAASTHPEQNLRLSSQRMLLALNRYREGATEPKFPEAVKPSAIRDLHAVAEYEMEWAFEKPKSLEEIAKRLKTVVARENGAYGGVEFTRLVLSLDKILLEKGLGSDADRAAFRGAMEAIASADREMLLSSRKLRAFAGHDPATRDLIQLPDHAELMNRIPAYREKEHLGWIRAEVLKGTTPLEYKPLARALRLAPAAAVVEEFRENLKQELRANASSFGPRFTYNVRFANAGDLEFSIRLADLYHREVVPSLPPVDRLRFEMGTSHESEYVIPTHRGRSGEHLTRQPGILTDRMRLLGDPRKTDLHGLVKAHMQRFWDRRGYYGTLEILSEFVIYDWEAIWSTLGIDPAVGRQQLRAAVKKFVSSKEYADLLGTIASARGVDEFSRLNGGGAVTKMPGSLDWTDESLYEPLTGRSNTHLSGKPELAEMARKQAASVLLDLPQYSSLRSRVYTNTFRSLADKPERQPLTADHLLETHWAATREIFAEPPAPGMLLMSTFDHLPGEPEQKRLFLRKALVGDGGENLDWLLGRGRAKKGGIVALLLKNRAAESSTELLRLLKKSPFRKDELFYDQYFATLGDIKDALLREWEAAISSARGAAEKRRIFLRYVDEFLDPASGRYEEGLQGNTKNVRALKSKLLSLGETLDLSRDEKLRLFQMLSATGPNQATDVYFRKNLSHLLTETLSSDAYRELRSLSLSERFQSPVLQVDAARKLLGGELERLEARGNTTTAEAESLVQRLKRFA
ncbi:MAG: hypothetical protein HUU37_07865, partial [Bdellovibrionales bacterium]|nr:hypothetical protein [Bdellovibrionales bacterium]